MGAVGGPTAITPILTAVARGWPAHGSLGVRVHRRPGGIAPTGKCRKLGVHIQAGAANPGFSQVLGPGQSGGEPQVSILASWASEPGLENYE